MKSISYVYGQPACNGYKYTCNDGVRTRTEITCPGTHPPPPPTVTCTLDGATYSVGQNHTFYKVKESNSCSSYDQVRTCQSNGKFSGNADYKYKTCASPGMSNSAARKIVIDTMKSVLERTTAEINGDADGVTYWTGRVKNGLSKAGLTNEFKASDEYFVRQAYHKHLKRKGGPAEVKYYVKELEAKRINRAWLVSTFTYACQHKLNGECK